jgi:hypothetical protein
VRYEVSYRQFARKVITQIHRRRRGDGPQSGLIGEVNWKMTHFRALWFGM